MFLFSIKVRKIVFFFNPYDNDELKQLLNKLIDFNKPLVFGVSFGYFCVYFSSIENVEILNNDFRA